jgi:hypothetical protein
MIMSAIFIETFFSTCGACAPADAVSASESIAVARNLRVIMFSSLSERPAGGILGYNTAAILIFYNSSSAEGNARWECSTGKWRWSPEEMHR